MGELADIVVDQRLRDIQREYLEFLEDEEDSQVYTQLIRDMISNDECRLIVNINDLRKKNSKRVLGLLNSAFEEIPAFHRALKEYVTAIDATFAKKQEEVFVGFEGSFGGKHVSPRTLTARNLGNLVCVEGIITKCSLVRPKVLRSVHYCPATKKTLERRYTDMTSFDPFPSSALYPTKDEDGNLLETEYGLCKYKDHQTVTVQEMPEKSPAGQLPRSVDVILDNDLVDKCKPGDRIQVIGVYRCLPNKQNGMTSGTFRTILLANNIIQLNKELSPHISMQDVKRCKNFSKQKIDVFELLAKSLAPSIHGHDYIKKALLCMLLGGVEKVLPNGTRLRGLEAGAMVLGDRGIVCIDEFDKMSDMDRTAIHEVMEQGQVTISKAGIHARLNARCSVLAAANPVYGRYDQYKTPMENIGLQDSLLSRFDCLFIMLDIADAESDRMIADHVVRMHRYRMPNEQDGEALPMGTGVDLLTTDNLNDAESDEEDVPIYDKYDALLHGNLRNKKDKFVNIKFMRKYIHIAKLIKPALSREACDVIAEEYSRLRSQDKEHADMARTQPVTVRALETLIRLSTAHAKARLSRTVEVQDAEAAIEMVQYAYFKKLMEKKKRKRDDDNETEDEIEAESQGESRKKKMKAKPSQAKPKQPRKKPGEEGYDPYDIDSAEDDDTEGPMSPTVASLHSRSRRKSQEAASEATTQKEISKERFALFKSTLFTLIKTERSETIPMDKVNTYMGSHPASEPFTRDEIGAALEKMTEANAVMIVDEMLFVI